MRPLRTLRTLRAFFIRLAGLLAPGRRDQAFDEELESHLAFHIEDNLRAGMTPDAARRAALLKLGGVAQTREAFRDRRGLPCSNMSCRTCATACARCASLQPSR